MPDFQHLAVLLTTVPLHSPRLGCMGARFLLGWLALPQARPLAARPLTPPERPVMPDFRTPSFPHTTATRVSSGSCVQALRRRMPRLLNRTGPLRYMPRETYLGRIYPIRRQPSLVYWAGYTTNRCTPKTMRTSSSTSATLGVRPHRQRRPSSWAYTHATGRALSTRSTD